MPTIGLKFGTSLPAVQQIPTRAQAWERAIGGPELLQAARTAERAGFAYVSCSDHVCVPASRAPAMGATWFDAGSTLAFVAAATERIGLLPHVLVLPYRHPLIVAKQYGTLDYLSGGRLILGVGSGHLKPEFKVLGADYERRGRVSDEYVAAIAAAWENEVARFDGETVAFHDVVVSPRVAQRPRPSIWVGGNSRAAVRRAAGGAGRAGSCSVSKRSVSLPRTRASPWRRSTDWSARWRSRTRWSSWRVPLACGTSPSFPRSTTAGGRAARSSVMRRRRWRRASRAAWSRGGRVAGAPRPVPGRRPAHASVVSISSLRPTASSVPSTRW